MGYKPNVSKWNTDKATVFAKLKDGTVLKIHGLDFKDTTLQMLETCLARGYITKKEVLGRLNVLVYIDR